MNEKLNTYCPLVQFVGKTLGNFYSVSLFEYKNSEYQLITHYNLLDNYVEKIIHFIRENMNDKEVLNLTIELEMNKIDKISLYPIFDYNQLIGVMCITMKCNPFIKLNSLVHDFLNFDLNEDNNQKQYPLTLEGIQEYIIDFGITNEKPNKNERLDVVCDLYDMGMFNIKGSIEYVAEKLQTSTKTIYRYISNIKESRD